MCPGVRNTATWLGSMVFKVPVLSVAVATVTLVAIPVCPKTALGEVRKEFRQRICYFAKKRH